VKQCRICLQEKEYAGFYPRDSTVDGYRSECKNCCVEKSKARYRKDLEASRLWQRENHRKKLELNPNWHVEHYAANKERMSVYNAVYYRERNREKRLDQAKQWAQDNPGMANANKKAYKVAKIKACPQWVRDDADLMWMISQAYELAVQRSKMLGYSWHVDHIVPLRGKTVSGLHVPWNLQVIPSVENMSKSNKFRG
jgi:hypothetical protein